MTLTAIAGDGTTHEFPDGTDKGVVDFAMKKYALDHTSAGPAATGPAVDDFFKDSAPGRILDAFGQGFKDNWGASNLAPDLEKDLKDAGIFNDYENGRTSAIKSVNEAFL